jgi:hypothetical protein
LLKVNDADTEENLPEGLPKDDLLRRAYIVYMPEIDRKFYGGNMRLGEKKTAIRENS